MLKTAQHRRTSALARYCETFGELTLRRQTELAMSAAKAESDLANRAKSALLGTMSHELRTPLNAIIGFSDLIKSMQADEVGAVAKSADYAGYIGDAGRHLLEVVTDILDMSKIESGTFQLDLQSCSIAQIVADTLPIVAARLQAKNQRLEPRIQRGIPRLYLDGRRIRQILINLLSNASKFTPEGGRIMIVARGNKDGGVTVCVVDSGLGMTAEEIAIALSPFGQVQSHLSRSHEGAGLGLPIAIGLARQHGGDLYLESEPGVGTEAVLTLPGPHSPPGAARRGGGERRKPRRAAHSPRTEPT